MSGLWYFWGSLALLLGGYFVYGAFVEKVFGADFGRLTPVKSRRDGVDYIELPRYKIFLIQLLNIAGLGPVIGPILGALYGPSALLWVVFGCIFGGAVHDYCSAMMSLRYGGASYPEIIGRNLGTGVRRFMEVFAIAFMIMVGAVFVLGPAALLANLTSFGLPFWATLIFAYYFLATIMPIDTIIGRIYPFFSVLLLVMAFGLAGSLMLSGRPVLPNTDFFVNTDPTGLPIWPLLFITIACGAISGFHATQSPLMTRCMESEKHGRMLFYGPMIAEGVLGLIWVTLGLSFYESPEALGAVIKAGTPTLVVQEISMALLGPIGGMLAILGVVVLPISTGDTAFRSARLLVADTLRIDQGPIGKRLMIAVPLFTAGIALTFVDFAVIWRYFGSPLPSVLKRLQLDEKEYVARTVMYINTKLDGAYVFSSGKNMGAFKAVGFPEDVGRFYRLDEYEAYSWTAHGRYPTNTPGWWGGAHPFALLDYSVVHNGEISSYDANRRYIEMFGYKCNLLTDTEVITYIIDYLNRRQGLSLEEAASVIAASFWETIERRDEQTRKKLTYLRSLYAPLLINGPFSILLGFEGGIMALNDRLKLRSMVVAEKSDRFYVASEECAIRILEPEPDRIYAPRGGEPVIVTLREDARV